MNKAKEEILSDAIKTAIEYRKTIIIQRRVIILLLIVCSILTIMNIY